MSDADGTEFLKLKEQGNETFKNNKLEEALKCYNDALKVAKTDTEKATIYKNQSAVYCKLQEYEKCAESASKALDILPNDAKALYRRAVAYEHLDKLKDAYNDARRVLVFDAEDKSTQALLRRLVQKIERVNEQNSLRSEKIRRVCAIAFSPEEDVEKREKAINNLLVIADEGGGAEELYESNIVEKTCNLIRHERDKKKLHQNAVRLISSLCKDSEKRTKSIIKDLTIPRIFDIMDSKEEDIVHSGQHFYQTILNSLTGLSNAQESSPIEELCQRNREEIDALLGSLVKFCSSRVISGYTRDAILQLIARNVHYKAVNWASALIKMKGLQRLLEVASELPEYKYESAMDVTQDTKELTSVCLARVYENMYYDEARREYLENVEDFIKEKLLTPNIESKVLVTVAITVLLRGPMDVGNTIIGKGGIMEMVIVMAGTDDPLQQKVACECILAAITRPDIAKVVLSKGVEILKKLYTSKDDGVRIRALVGLCKIGSSGGTDSSIRLFADGSNKKLAEACKKFVVSSKDVDTKRWAAEGLSYLTFDAEVKEQLIEDKSTLKALIEVAKNSNQSSIYSIVTIFVNLCNAYEKQEILPEMIELAKFAKRHIPEEHELDDEDFVTKRILTLGESGITSALVALAKTESNNCKELISRVFNALAGKEKLRGLIVQQGGVKTLLILAKEGTPNGMKQAAQALARIGITINPRDAFPGERAIEVIRPLLMLLLPECPALMNFESLLALCNLASVDEKTRKHIIKEGGFSKIESYIYEDHEMLKRAATQCITNLAMSADVVKIFEGENDKFKYLFLLMCEEDTETAKAAAGAVAMLTAASTKCCKKIFSVKDWVEVFKQILAHPDKDVQHRAVVTAHNVVCSNKECCEELLNTEVMEILMALSIIPDDDKKDIRYCAQDCLQAAEEKEIIRRRNEDEDND